MPLPPTLSPEQRQAALEKAAAARRMRAELKEKLKMGSLSLKELLAQSASDEIVGKMKVLAVLESLPGLGKVRSASVRPVGCRASVSSSAGNCSSASAEPGRSPAWRRVPNPSSW
jgi:hypothetical protein